MYCHWKTPYMKGLILQRHHFASWSPWAHSWGPGELAGDVSWQFIFKFPRASLPWRVELGYPPYFSDGGFEAGRGPCLLALTALTWPHLPSGCSRTHGFTRAQCQLSQQTSHWDRSKRAERRGTGSGAGIYRFLERQLSITEVNPQSQSAPKLFLFRLKMNYIVGYFSPNNSWLSFLIMLNLV